MCGRINLTSAPHVLAEKFYLDMVPDLVPRWNIAPGQEVATVVPNPRGPGRLLQTYRWGIVPGWQRAGDEGPRPINARSETAADKPTFRDAFAARRCLVPVNGFYEWQKRPGGAAPWLFRRADAEPFALAGLWEPPAAGADRGTCAILTTRANRIMRPIHDRMPVVLPESDWRPWLELPAAARDELAELLRPAPAELLVAHRVDRKVNSPAWDEPGCVERVADDGDDQLDLFG